MGFTESERHFKCPCYGKGEDFQKVVDLKDIGLVIYRYKDRKINLDQTAHSDNNTTQSAIILQNTKNMKLLSAEILPELDKNKITCPRCRKTLRRTQELLNNITGIDKDDVLGICDHCRLKAQTQKPCNECSKIVQKFLSTHRKQKGDLKKYVKLWLTTIGHVLDRPHKITTRTYSEKDLDLSVLETGKSVGKLGTQPMFHSETNLSDSNLLKTRMPQKPPPLDLGKGVHLRESYKPAETFPMTRSDSEPKISRVDSIQEKIDHISEHDTKKAIKHIHLTEDEKNMQRRMAKYRHDKEEVELAIKTKEEILSGYKKLMKSQKHFSDPDLQKDFSFFFPEISQQSLRKPIVLVSSSQSIRLIQKKIGLKSEEEEKKVEDESKRRLEMDENRISREEKITQDKEDTTAEEQNKTGMRETLTDQEQKRMYEKEKFDIKRQLEEEHPKTTESSSIKEPKLATVARKARKIEEDDSNATIKKYTTEELKQKDKEIDKFEYKKRDRERKLIKTIDDPYTLRFKQPDEKSSALREQKKTIDGQKPQVTGKEIRKTISKEFKEKEFKRGHGDEGKIKETYKDTKGEKLIAIQSKAQTTKKDTIQTIPKKADALLKSERREKDTETTKLKKIKSQDNLKKLFSGPKPLSDLKPSNQVDKQSKEKKDKKTNIEEGIVQAKSKDVKGDKSIPAEDKTQAVEKHTTHKTSEKADTILKSEQKEKDKEVKRSKNIEKGQENLKKIFNAPKHLSDQSDKQLTGKVDKKKQLEEKEIQSKLKDLKIKDKPMLPSEMQNDKIKKQPISGKADTIITSEQKEKEKDKEVKRSKNIETGQENLKKLFNAPKLLSDQSDKQLTEKVDKKRQLEEKEIQSKLKDIKIKEKPILPLEMQSDKITKQPISEKADTIIKSEQKEKEKDKEVKRSKNIEKDQENLRKLFNAPKLLSDQGDKQLTEKVDKKRQLEEKEIQSKLKDLKIKEKPILPLEMQSDKITKQPISEKADTIIKSELKEKEKDKEVKRSKNIEKDQENLRKLFNAPKLLSDQGDKQLTEKVDKKRQLEEKEIQSKLKDIKIKEKPMLPSEMQSDKITKQTISEKADTIIKSEHKEKEKDKEVKRSENIEKSQENLRKLFNVPKLLSDQADKQLTEKIDKKRQLEEKEIQSKLKDIKIKEKPMLPSEMQSDKITKQSISEKPDTIIKSEQKEKEKDNEVKRSKNIEKSQEILRKLFNAPKLLSDQVDKQLILIEKEDKKRQHEEAAIKAKVKDTLAKEKKILLPEIQTDKVTMELSAKKDTTPKVKQDGQDLQKPHKERSVEIKMGAIKMLRPSKDEFMQLIVNLNKKPISKHELDEINKKIKKDDPLNKPLREAKAVVKPDPKRPIPPPTTPTNTVSEQQVSVRMTQIKLHKPSTDDQILNLIRIKQSVPRRRSIYGMPSVDRLLMKHHKKSKNIPYIIYNDSELSLKSDSYNTQILHPAKIEGIIIGEDLLQQRPSFFPVHVEQQQVVPLLFKSEYFEKPPSEPCEQIKEVSEEDNNNKVDPEAKKGIIRYALSDRSFIDKGWTLLPTEKVVRKMNVYRMRPAHPEFDWFEHNKHKRFIQYDTCEKFAEFDDNGRGRWYYKNGRLALDYYDAEETNAQQRFVVYSSGEPDERGRSHPITVLATFDYLGNGIVLDHAGKIRLSTKILLEYILV